MSDTMGTGGRPASGGVGDPLNRASADLRATADQVTSQAGEAASRLRDEAAGALADVKAEAAGVVDEARERATSFAEQQKQAGAEQAEGLARAVHRAADELQDTSPQLAQYVREAAASVRQLAHTMRGQSVGNLVGEVEGMARRQPVAFFGAAVLAGFALSRFVKSSAEGVRQEPYQPGGRDPVAGSMAGAHPSVPARVYPSVAAPGYVTAATPGQTGPMGSG